MDKNKTNVQSDVERLTKIWWEDAAEKFRVMPLLYNLLTTIPMTFDVSTKGVIVTLEVANHSQEEWLKLKIIPELTSYLKSLSVIESVEIRPVVNHTEGTVIIIDTISDTFRDPDAPLIVKDFELDID